VILTQEKKDIEESGIDWSWEDEASSFPSKGEIEPWQYYTEASDDLGDSRVLQARISPEIGRKVDELIQRAKENGIPIKTTSDFLRVAVMRFTVDLTETLKLSDENISHWLFQKREMLRQAEQMALTSEGGGIVRDFTQGFTVLVNGKYYVQAKKKLVDFLTSAHSLRSEHEFLSQLYLDLLFRNGAFLKALEILEEKLGDLGSSLATAKSVVGVEEGES
jgi:molybdopterin converting factor small subunit